MTDYKGHGTPSINNDYFKHKILIAEIKQPITIRLFCLITTYNPTFTTIQL